MIEQKVYIPRRAEDPVIVPALDVSVGLDADGCRVGIGASPTWIPCVDSFLPWGTTSGVVSGAPLSDVLRDVLREERSFRKSGDAELRDEGCASKLIFLFLKPWSSLGDLCFPGVLSET